MNTVKKPLLRTLSFAEKGRVFHLLDEIADYLSDLKEHKITEGKLENAYWKNPKDDDVLAAERLHNLIEDYLEMESLVSNTVLLKNSRVFDIKIKVQLFLKTLRLWEDFKEDGIRLLRRLAVKSTN